MFTRGILDEEHRARLRMVGALERAMKSAVEDMLNDGMAEEKIIELAGDAVCRQAFTWRHENARRKGGSAPSV